jgi:hypothetical protein
VSSAALIAPMPELVARAASPPSRLAATASSAVVVGLAYRLYAKPALGSSSARAQAAASSKANTEVW